MLFFCLYNKQLGIYSRVKFRKISLRTHAASLSCSQLWLNIFFFIPTIKQCLKKKYGIICILDASHCVAWRINLSFLWSLEKHRHPIRILLVYNQFIGATSNQYYSITMCQICKQKNFNEWDPRIWVLLIHLMDLSIEGIFIKAPMCFFSLPFNGIFIPRKLSLRSTVIIYNDLLYTFRFVLV